MAAPRLVAVNCGVCGASDSTPLHRIRGMRIEQCRRCGLIYTNPRYPCDYATSPASLTERLATYERDYWPKRLASAERFWGSAEAYRSSGHLLDIGCGFGFFLKEAHARGWLVTGVEIARDEAEWGRDHFGLSVLPALEDASLDAQRFDVITLWDVVEHIPDVHALLRRCRGLLHRKGVVFIRTPNADGLLVRPAWWSLGYLQLYWQLVYPANPLEHIYHFTPNTLTRVLRDNAYRVISLSTEQPWEERVLAGRNRAVAFVRTGLMWLAWRFRLPYEMALWAVSANAPSGDSQENVASR